MIPLFNVAWLFFPRREGFTVAALTDGSNIYFPLTEHSFHGMMRPQPYIIVLACCFSSNIRHKRVVIYNTVMGPLQWLGSTKVCMLLGGLVRLQWLACHAFTWLTAFDSQRALPRPLSIRKSWVFAALWRSLCLKHWLSAVLARLKITIGAAILLVSRLYLEQFCLAICFPPCLSCLRDSGNY